MYIVHMLMSNEIKREVVERYNRGERATDLAKEYGISRGIIYRWIKEEFPMEEEVMAISAEQKEELLRRFFQGESASALASEYNISRAVIYKWIKQNGGLVKMDRDTYNNLESEKLKKQIKEIQRELRYVAHYIYELERSLGALIDEPRNLPTRKEFFDRS